MIKLLLAEDNRMTLTYLEQQIPWKDHGIQLVGAVTNGQKALASVEKHNPDIVLTDIQMPGMNGLQLTESIRQRWPHIKTVILTAYDHFEYSQRALKLGAVDYILKPINDTELLRVIDRVRDTVLEVKKKQAQNEQMLKQIEKSLPLLQQDFFIKLITGYYEQSESFDDIIHFLNLPFHDYPYSIAVFVIDDLNSKEGMDFKEKEIILFSLKACLKAELPSDLSKYMFFYHDQLTTFINFSDDHNNTDDTLFDLRSIIHLCSQVQYRFQKETGYTLSVGISHFHRDLTFAKLAYTEAKSSLDHRFFIGKGSIIYKGDLTDRPVQKNKTIITDKKIISLTISGNIEELTEYLEYFRNKLQSAYSEEFIKKLKLLLIGILFQSLSQLYELDLVSEKENLEFKEKEVLNLLQCETFETAFNLFKERLMKICRYIMESRQTRSDGIIHKAVSYISLNYTKDINLERVAEYVGLNASYFSHLFKKIMGISFTSILAETRIDNAKVLLTNPVLKTSDIAELVGIHNPRYFTQLFKRYTGMTPSEYKSKI
jgi:two-component system response regulator YesN